MSWAYPAQTLLLVLTLPTIIRNPSAGPLHYMASALICPGTMLDALPCSTPSVFPCRSKTDYLTIYTTCRVSPIRSWRPSAHRSPSEICYPCFYCSSRLVKLQVCRTPRTKSEIEIPFTALHMYRFVSNDSLSTTSLESTVAWYFKVVSTYGN